MLRERKAKTAYKVLFVKEGRLVSAVVSTDIELEYNFLTFTEAIPELRKLKQDILVFKDLDKAKEFRGTVLRGSLLYPIFEVQAIGLRRASRTFCYNTALKYVLENLTHTDRLLKLDTFGEAAYMAEKVRLVRKVA